MRKNIAILSVGSHAKKTVIPTLLKSKEWDVVGFYTRSQLTSAELTENYNIYSFESEQALYTSSIVDAVYISSPTSEHSRQVIECLKNYKSVLVEKTAFPSLLETRQAVEIAIRNRCVIMEGFMYKHHRMTQSVSEIIARQVYGPVRQVNISFGFPNLKLPNIRYQKELDGGALNDCGAYVVSAAYELFGDKIQRISSIRSIRPDLGVDVQGAFLAKAGREVFVSCTWGFGLSYTNKVSLMTESHHVSAMPFFSKPKSITPHIKIEKNNEIVETINLGADCQFTNMFAEFFSRISSGDLSKNYELVKQASLMEEIRNYSAQ